MVSFDAIVKNKQNRVLYADDRAFEKDEQSQNATHLSKMAYIHAKQSCFAVNSLLLGCEVMMWGGFVWEHGKQGGHNKNYNNMDGNDIWWCISFNKNLKHYMENAKKMNRYGTVLFFMNLIQFDSARFNKTCKISIVLHKCYSSPIN